VDTYETKSVSVGVALDVLRQSPVRHPIGDELERGGGDTEEGDDVFVFQPFPHDSLLVERLRVSSVSVHRERDSIDSALLWPSSDRPWRIS
jgi:hypothetical protein